MLLHHSDVKMQIYCRIKLFIVKEGCIPEDWKSSVVLPIYKGKEDPMECGSYRGIKLLEHAMKVVERIFEDRIRQQIDIVWIYERQRNH